MGYTPKIGIYKITNLDNGKVYVGQTDDIERRWRQHVSDLNAGKHHNIYLQNSWNIHGQDRYEFSIIELCEKDELREKEIYWIDKLRAYRGFEDSNGYNGTLGGDGGYGHICTEEQRQLLYEKSSAQEIIQLDINGNFINRWRSSAYASRQLNIPVSGIRNCVLESGDQYQCSGYIWISAKSYDSGDFDYNSYKKKYLSYYLKEICKYDLYGNIICSWGSQKELLEEHPELGRYIKRLLTHSVGSHDGFIYLYKEDEDILTDDYLRDCRVKSYRYKINQYDLNYNFIKTYTQEEIEQLPYRTATIKKCCSNRYAHTKNGLEKAFGYIWEYE